MGGRPEGRSRRCGPAPPWGSAGAERGSAARSGPLGWPERVSDSRRRFRSRSPPGAGDFQARARHRRTVRTSPSQRRRGAELPGGRRSLRGAGRGTGRGMRWRDGWERWEHGSGSEAGPEGTPREGPRAARATPPAGRPGDRAGPDPGATWLGEPDRCAAPPTAPRAPPLPASRQAPSTAERAPPWTLWSLSGGQWACIVLWSAAWATTLLEAGAGEPLALRWLRACAEHPLRTLLAGLALAHAGRRGP